MKCTTCGVGQAAGLWWWEGKPFCGMRGTCKAETARDLDADLDAAKLALMKARITHSRAKFAKNVLARRGICDDAITQFELKTWHAMIDAYEQIAQIEREKNA